MAMSNAQQYCRMHGTNPCHCYAAFDSLPPDTSTTRSEAGSTPSQPRSSPRDTSSSGVNSNTAGAGETETQVSGSAFSPLAPCFRNSNDAETDEGVPDPDLPPTIQNGPQNRLQLLQRFYDLHLGSSTHARAIFQYETIGSGNIGRATTTSAMDTLCIAQLGTSFQDPQMMAESRRMYSQTMRLLAANVRAIGEVKPSPEQLDDIIGGIHALTAASWFRCVGVGELDWTKHAQALLRVLKVRSSHRNGSGQDC